MPGTQIADGVEVAVWDTRHLPAREAFGIFKDAMCRDFGDCTVQLHADHRFEAHIEALLVDHGGIANVNVSPIFGTRSQRNIDQSPLGCLYANYVVTGEVFVEQNGRSNLVRSGELVIYDADLPTSFATRGRNLCFLIPRSRAILAHNIDGNIVYAREQMVPPLASCLNFLAQSSFASADEVQALFDAVVSLLPLARVMDDAKGQGCIPSYLLRGILKFIDRNINDAELSPRKAASHAGVSVRYVHMLFASTGTTFSSYVTAKRLEHIRQELSLTGGRRLPISAVAYRWGFNDLSTFSRVFKKRFGVSPSALRSAS